MINEAISNIALLYSMAALDGEDGAGGANSPYKYAVKVGFKGSEEKFQQLWLASLNSGYTNSILDGGIADYSEQKVWNDGGKVDSNNYLLNVDGNNKLDE